MRVLRDPHVGLRMYIAYTLSSLGAVHKLYNAKMAISTTPLYVYNYNVI